MLSTPGAVPGKLLNPSNDMNDIKEQLAGIPVRVRIGFGQSWSLLNQVQDIAERHGAKLVGGSELQGQSFYEIPFGSLAAFRQDLTSAGFVATLS